MSRDPQTTVCIVYVVKRKQYHMSPTFITFAYITIIHYDTVRIFIAEFSFTHPNLIIASAHKTVYNNKMCSRNCEIPQTSNHCNAFLFSPQSVNEQILKMKKTNTIRNADWEITTQEIFPLHCIPASSDDKHVILASPVMSHTCIAVI
jgi:hypothetical protein